MNVLCSPFSMLLSPFLLLLSSSQGPWFDRRLLQDWSEQITSRSVEFNSELDSRLALRSPSQAMLCQPEETVIGDYFQSDIDVGLRVGCGWIPLISVLLDPSLVTIR